MRWHPPRFYRYTVARSGVRRPKWNQYHAGRDRQCIGAYVVLGRYAYCVKWADCVFVGSADAPLRPPARSRRLRRLRDRRRG